MQFSWVSASEGARFAEVVTKVTEDVKALGPSRRLNVKAAAAESEAAAQGYSGGAE